MEDSRRAKQALNWFPDEKKARSTACYMEGHILERHRIRMDTTWEDVCLKATDREEWKQWTARCASHWKD